MISCAKAKTMFSMYMDNELNKADKDEFELHIRSCSDCRAELTELQQIISLVAGIGDEDLPEDFKKNLHEKLEQASKSEKSRVETVALRNKYIKIFSTMAACLLLVVFVKGVFDGHLLNSTSMKKSEVADQYTTAARSAPKQSADQKSTGSTAAGNENTSMSAYDIAGGAENKAKASNSKGEGQASTGKTTDGNAAKADKQSVGEDPQIAYGDAEKRKGTEDGNISADTDKSISQSKMSAFTQQRAEQPQTSSNDNKIEKSDNKVIKTVTVMVMVENVRKATTQTKTYASANSPASVEPQMSIAATSLLPQEPTSEAMDINVPLTQYNQFTSYLQSTYGKDNVKFDEVTTIDPAEEIASLESKLAQVNTRLEQLKGNGDPQEIAQLNLEKEEILAEIAKTKDDEGHIHININFVKK